ncbi:methyltransferase family protein [Chloroflexota bacterium]
MKGISIKENLWMIVLTILCIACFPINPLVLTGLLKPGYYLPLFVLGWISWAIGKVLVMAPIIMFPRRGGVSKGKTFVHTTQVVNTGIYSVIRHPQYTGGILSIFIATPLLFPHWVLVVLGIPGAIILYWSTFEEDKRLIEQFGNDYQDYINRVPRANILLGIYRVIINKSSEKQKK